MKMFPANEIPRWFLSVLAGLSLVATAPVLADNDSSADAAGSFNDVMESMGVIIRVPTDAAGRENTDAAEMRLHKGADLSTAGDLVGAFDAAIDLSTQPLLGKDTSTDGDVSTGHHGFGWNNWHGSGWQSHHYYNSYQPSYWYYGSYYSYYRPYYGNYYNYYNSWNHCGYSYYYYNRYW